MKFVNIYDQCLSLQPFLKLHRKQKVKFSNDCVFECGEVRAGVPKTTEVSTWKYIDGTTVPKVAKKGDTSKAQDKVTTLENWSNSNRLLLNADKCKELQMDFKSTKQSFDPLTVNG